GPWPGRVDANGSDDPLDLTLWPCGRQLQSKTHHSLNGPGDCTGELRSDRDLLAARRCFLDLYVPPCGGNCAHISVAGQRRVYAATRIAREFLARRDVEHRWLSSVVGRGARGGRGLDCAHSQRGGCLCDQWRSVVD